MKIDANTRISAIIKHNKESIEAIASIAKVFEKLKNPILRKVMAPRVNLAEAAKIGSCTVEDFAIALKPLGFSFETDQKTSEQKVTNQEVINSSKTETPDWLKNRNQDTVDEFDVRKIIESGSDPLKEIIKRFKKIKPGCCLCIINSFVPTPLIRLLEKDGVKTHTQQIDDEVFHTYFLKPTQLVKKDTKSKAEKVFVNSKNEFQKIYDRFQSSHIKRIDVRKLEMPLPMQTILKELALLEDNAALYVDHKRVPIYLLEELADQDFEVHIYNQDENEVKLILFKN